MVVIKGTDLSKRALSHINCLGKHNKLVKSMLEYREVVLEASHSQADNEDHLPFAFILQLCREAARSELIEGLEEQLPPNLSLLVVHTSIAEDNEDEVDAAIHEIQGFLCTLKRLITIEL